VKTHPRASCLRPVFTHQREQLLHIVKDVVIILHESFFIHPSVPSSIHGWHHTGKKTLTEINKPPLCAHVLLSRKGMPGPRGGHPQGFDITIVVNFLFEWHLGYICRLRSFTMVSCMLLSHGSQAVQTSRFSAARVPWIYAECGI
jgi:hypothetical protein